MRLQRMVYEVYLRHGEVVLPRVVRAEIPGVVVNASGRSYPLEQAIIAARNQWRAEGRPLPRPRPSASLRECVWLACFHCASAPAAPPLLHHPFAQQHHKLLGPPNSGRSVAEWAPSLKRATDACVLASNNTSPAQRGPRRDAQPLHATPLAAVLFPAPLRALFPLRGIATLWPALSLPNQPCRAGRACGAH